MDEKTKQNVDETKNGILKADLHQKDKYGRNLRFYNPKTRQSEERPVLKAGLNLSVLSVSCGIAKCHVYQGAAGGTYYIPEKAIEYQPATGWSGLIADEIITDEAPGKKPEGAK